MSLIERYFPVARRDFNFFDQVFANMQQEFDQMEREMAAMRSQMFHLVPHNLDDNMQLSIFPKVPIVEEKGETKLKLEFDVHKFKPEEVQVKIMGNDLLQVQAKHEAKTDSGEEFCMFTRQYRLPEGVDANNVRPMLSKDGVLTIEAPAPSLKPSERMVPIEYKK